MQFVREFAKLGLTRSVGGVLALALARELTPVVTSIILAGRVGSAFAAELGTMSVRIHSFGLQCLSCMPTVDPWLACQLIHVFAGIRADGLIANAWIRSDRLLGDTSSAGLYDRGASS